MRDQDKLPIQKSEVEQRITRRRILGAGALTGALLLSNCLSSCNSNEREGIPRALDPTAPLPGMDGSPSAEKTSRLIIDEQSFNNWGSMTPKERELAAIDCLTINGAQEALPSYSTGVGSHRDVPRLWRWLQNRGLFIQKVYEKYPTVAEHLVETLITNEANSPLKDMRIRSPFDYFGMWKASDIGNYRRSATNEKFTGFVAMCREIDERARDVSGLSIECSFKKDAEGNNILQIDKAEQCFVGDDPSPAVQKFVVDND